MSDTPHVRCIAIIPARGGSKGIPRKNLMPVGGVPLVARSILAAKESLAASGVYVSTDDIEIAEVAEIYGAKVIMRPLEISGDTASSESAILHALATLKQRGVQPEITVFLQCTSPFTTAASIDAVVKHLADPAFAMAFSAAEDHVFLWGLSETGEGFGINHDHTKPRKRRQELPVQLRETGAIYAMRTTDFIRVENRFCGPVRPVPLDLPTLDIDSMQDLRLANALCSFYQEA